MHPELLRALARARHNDLLSTHQTRARPTVHRRAQARLTRPRQRLGALLIWSGARLMGVQPSALELAQK
jgi:hypothetical protein